VSRALLARVPDVLRTMEMGYPRVPELKQVLRRPASPGDVVVGHHDGTERRPEPTAGVERSTMDANDFETHTFSESSVEPVPISHKRD
jgi:hypothetical protein